MGGGVKAMAGQGSDCELGACELSPSLSPSAFSLLMGSYSVLTYM